MGDLSYNSVEYEIYERKLLVLTLGGD